MLSFRVFARLHPRRLDVLPIVYSRVSHSPYTHPRFPSRKSLSYNSFADPHPLTPATSMFYKNRAGRGYVVRPVRPLAATLMGLPRRCCKQKTYGIVKPFRCNTYKKVGLGAPPDPSYKLAGSRRLTRFM